MSNLTMEQVLELSDDELLHYELPKPDKTDDEEKKELESEEITVEAEEVTEEVTKEVTEETEPEETEEIDEEKDKKTLDTEKELLSKIDNLDNQEKEVVNNEETTEAINYEEFYTKVMAPFKANGRTIKLDSPDDVITMLQKGANYTKKMQELAPYRNLLMMLQKNEITDEDKLSFLIDLDKKNPDAIKKLVQESGIDPLELDVSTEIKYNSSSHRVTQEEAAFTATLDEIKTQPNGQETLLTINSWDIASKNEIFSNPEDLYAIHEQKLSGVYDLIADEVEKQRILGKIPTTMPFIKAYKIVGAALAQQATMQKSAPPVKIDTKIQTPKQTVANDKKAKAASPTKVGSKPAKEFENPLAMSDDEFMKRYEGRL